MLIPSSIDSTGNVISVLIMKKETLIIHLESRQAKEQWLADFEACLNFASESEYFLHRISLHTQLTRRPPLQ